jgi:opacity protein-like surface antigen
LSRTLIGALVLAASANAAAAADYGMPPVAEPYQVAQAPAWYGPSPFAVSGSAYGLLGYGYYYDEPTEHRLGPPPGPRHRRAGR